MKLNEFIFESKVKLLETRSPNQILMELNVINIPQIDSFLQDIAQNLPNKETQKWFATRAKKYLINSEEDNSIITHFSGKAEPWMKQRQKEGVKLYRFNPSNELATKLSHIVDWIRAMHDTTTGAKASDQQSISRAKKALKGLNNTSITQAIELSNQWVRDMNSGKDGSYKRAEDEKGLVPVMVYGDYKWYKLTNQDCLDREGKVMGHCVASYGSDVASGKTVIYSLRDNNNFAHATVEVTGGKLEQVKGKRNAPPVAKYQRATVALLNTLNVPPTSSGLRDIQGMDFMHNPRNNKYGTVQDIGDKIYSEGGIDIWSIGSKDPEDTKNISIRIMAGDNTICSIARSRYRNDLEYRVINAEYMNNVKVKDAKHSDPIYKLAKLIQQVMPQPPSSAFDLNELASYMNVASDTGSLIMYEDLGEHEFSNNSDEIRFVKRGSVDGQRTDEYTHIQNGKLVSTFVVDDQYADINGRRTIDGTTYRGIETKSEDIISLYVNSMKPEDRPIVQSWSVYQNPKTFEASTDINETSETIAVSKSKNIGWYKVINSSKQASRRARNRRRYNIDSDLDATETELSYRYLMMSKHQPVLSIDVNEDETKHEFDIVYGDSMRNFTQEEIKEVADVCNKSGLNKFYPFTEHSVVTEFENKGLYFLREKRMFTTDHSIAGEHFKHDDKDFKAIKTHNHLKIYYKDAEVVVFDLDEATAIKGFHLKNRLAMLNNARKIADVLNHYEIHRQDQNNYGVEPGTNKKISQSGLTYSYDHGWKGMKTGPKPFEIGGNPTKKIGKNEYEIHSFKRDFLIQDTDTHELIATLKGYKNAGDPTLYVNSVKMESQTESAWDIIADALNELHEKDGINVVIRYDDRDEKLDFNEKMHSRGYLGTVGREWGSLATTFPSEVISKGTGGTWVKEAFVKDIDFKIRKLVDGAADSKWRDEEEFPGQKTIGKYQPYGFDLGAEKYTLYSRKTPVLRAFVANKSLQLVYRIDSDNNAHVLHTKQDLLKYGNAIGRLLHKIKTSGGDYLSNHQLYLAKAKLQDISKNPKLAGYSAGEIVYEDGHKWNQGSRYQKDTWTLTLTTDGKMLRLIEIQIRGDGIDSIKFLEPKVRKYTKLYRPFLNDMMDIVDQLHGSD